MLDWEETSSIHQRYVTAPLPKFFPRIFTSNERNIWFDESAHPPVDPEIKNAIRRRLKVIHVQGSLIKGVPVSALDAPVADDWPHQPAVPVDDDPDITMGDDLPPPPPPAPSRNKPLYPPGYVLADNEVSAQPLRASWESEYFNDKHCKRCGVEKSPTEFLCGVCMSILVANYKIVHSEKS